MGPLSINVGRLGRSLFEAPGRIEHDLESMFRVTPRRAAEDLASVGEHLLDDVDHLGARTVERLHIEPYRGPVNRIPWPVPVLGACVAIIVTVLGWTAFENAQQSNSWLTSPGAGNEAIAAQQETGQMMTPSAPAAPAAAGASQTAANVPAAMMGTAGLGGVGTLTATGPGSASATTPAAAAAPAAPAVQHVSLVVNPPPLGGINGPDGQVHDAFVPATFTMKVGTTYQVTVTNYDTAAHTWTSPDLGVNAAIAAGTDSAPATTTFTITPTRAGTFTWQCMAPCDPWAMTHAGFMEGSVTVEND